jgi:hypothetical protein
VVPRELSSCAELLGSQAEAMQKPLLEAAAAPAAVCTSMALLPPMLALVAAVQVLRVTLAVPAASCRENST